MIGTLIAAFADFMTFCFAVRRGMPVVEAHLVSCGVNILLLYS